MLRIFSVAYWVFFCATLPVFYVGSLVVAVVSAPWDRRRVLLHLYGSLWASFYILVNPFWRLHVEGRTMIPWRDSAVLVSNHASLIDILVLFGLFRPYRWVSKTENFKLPFIGWYMTHSRYVPLVRGDRASIETMMVTCRDLLRSGVSVMIFPEGTRSPTGELQAFKDGAFQLAWDTGRPVFPIAVTGTAEALPKHGLMLKKPMNARVVVLDPLDPGDFADFHSLRDATRKEIARYLESHG